MSTSQRIDFFDLVKGICILLVVSGHCGFPIDIPGYEIVRMPLYFILSGMFFKDYGGFKNLLIKKVNKIEGWSTYFIAITSVSNDIYLGL